jgi:hypothetical protein
VIFTEQILFVDIPFGAIGGRAFSGAPPFDQFKAIVAIDYADDGIEELLFGDVVLIDIGDVPTIDRGHRPSGLCGTEVTAIAERRRDVTLAGRDQS